MRIKLDGDDIAEIVKEHIEAKYAKPGVVVEVDVPYISGGVTVDFTRAPVPAPEAPTP
jgi:hypothetical protein